MKAANEPVKLWTKLLVAEHGRSQVIAALAEIEDVGFEAIEQEIDAHKAKRGPRRRSRRKSLTDLLKDRTLEPEKLVLVEKIGCAYENKRYLPELWRVRRFLESHGVSADGLRSRADALRSVIDVLERLSVGELEDLAAASKKTTGGDLAIIARQILGPGEKSSVEDRHDVTQGQRS